MEAVGQQLTAITAAIGELKCAMEELKDKVDYKFTQLESQVGELDRELKTVSKENKEKIQSNESLSTEMFERVFHNESSLQLKMEQMSSKMEEMKAKMASMALERRSQDLEASKHLETYEWTITDVKNKLRLNNWSCQSETFKFFGSKYDIKANLIKKSGLAIGLQFKVGNKINKFKGRQEFTKVKYIIRDQINAPNGRDIIYETCIKFVDCFAQLDWIFGQQIPVVILGPPYVKDNCIKIAMVFEPPSIDRSFVSNNGVLKWTVDNFIIRNQGQWHPNIWSPSFYTSPRGYKVQISLSINHNPIIALVNFFTGEHDASLSCIFPHKTTITLFNRIDPSKNLVKSEQRGDVSYYTIQLESYQFLKQNGFISNETILLKVVIDH